MRISPFSNANPNNVASGALMRTPLSH